MSAVDDILLERYLDNEMDPGERSGFEARIAQDPDAQERLSTLRAFQSAIVRQLDERASRLPAGALWARIETVLDAEQNATRPSLAERVRAWFQIPRFELGLSLGAAAAATVIVVWMSRTAPVPAALVPDVAEPQVSDNTFVVESYEVTTGTVVIDVPPDDPSMPAVVWYFDDDLDNSALGEKG